MTPFEQHPLDAVDGGPRSLMEWNSELWMDGVDPRRPLRLDVSFDLREPTPNGLPVGAESTYLRDLYPRLASFIRRKTSAKYAMRLSRGGRQEHVFYAPAKSGLLSRKDPLTALGGALPKFGANNGGYSMGVAVVDDPDWSRLMGIFSVYDPAQWHADRQLLIAMMKQRDAVMAKRPVAHKAHFAEREGCRLFLQAARKERFKSEGGPKKTKHGWTATVVRREQAVATWHIHPVVLMVKALASSAGGTYDGWEAELVARKDPVPLAPPGGIKVG